MGTAWPGRRGVCALSNAVAAGSPSAALQKVCARWSLVMGVTEEEGTERDPEELEEELDGGETTARNRSAAMDGSIFDVSSSRGMCVKSRADKRKWRNKEGTEG